MRTVAETFLTSPGDSSAAGSWSVTIPVTVAVAGDVSMGFNFTNQLTLIDTGSIGTTANLEAFYKYRLTIRASSGEIMPSPSPDAAVNLDITRTTPGTTNVPGSGTVMITATLPSPDIYTFTLTGSTNVTASLTPEPATAGLVMIAAPTVLVRRRRRTA
jgi:hypothetical protein